MQFASNALTAKWMAPNRPAKVIMRLERELAGETQIMAQLRLI